MNHTIIFKWNQMSNILKICSAAPTSSVSAARSAAVYGMDMDRWIDEMSMSCIENMPRFRSWVPRLIKTMRIYICSSRPANAYAHCTVCVFNKFCKVVWLRQPKYPRRASTEELLKIRAPNRGSDIIANSFICSSLRHWNIECARETAYTAANTNVQKHMLTYKVDKWRA